MASVDLARLLPSLSLWPLPIPTSAPFILYRVPFVDAQRAQLVLRVRHIGARFLPPFPIFFSSSLSLEISLFSVIELSSLHQPPLFIPLALTNRLPPTFSDSWPFSFLLVTMSRRVQQQHSILIPPPPRLRSLSRLPFAPSKKLRPIQSTCSPYPIRAHTRALTHTKPAQKRKRRNAPSTLRRPRTRIHRTHARPFGYISRAALIPAHIQSHPLISARSRRKKGKDKTRHED